MNNNQNPNQFSSEGEVGEIKTALGRLYKEFESFKQTYKADKEKDRAELQAWAQTSLIQNQLLSKAMITIEMLTNSLKNQGTSWQEFETSNENLKLELIRSQEQFLSTHSSLSVSDNLEFKGLKIEVASLKNTWENNVIGMQQELISAWSSVISHTQKEADIISKLKQNIQSQSQKIDRFAAEAFLSKPCIGVIVLFPLLALLFMLNLVPVHIPEQISNTIEKIWTRTDFIITKLQRIEKHLGTDPHQK